MKKTIKREKLIKAVIGLGMLAAFAIPASVMPAYSYDPGMPVPAGLRTEAEMQGGLNYKHPEDDLSLTTIAGKFFMNHTYLSSLFSRKSDLRYSQLVTMVKMKRAEHLINYTTLSLEDIALQLGYKDFRYFLNIFKKTIGKSASEYIRNEYEYSNYSL